MSRDPEDVDVPTLEHMIYDDALRKCVADAADELAVQPGPDQLVPQLVAMAER